MKLARRPAAKPGDGLSPAMAEFMDETVHQVAQIIVDLALVPRVRAPADVPEKQVVLAQQIARAVLARLLEEASE